MHNTNSDDSHPLVKHKQKIIDFIEEMKRAIVDDGDELADHLADGCPECEDAAEEIREKMEEIEDLKNGGGSLIDFGPIIDDGDGD